jgi:uncharacterized SAM-binding protein YcdF (DUF218 family)
VPLKRIRIHQRPIRVVALGILALGLVIITRTVWLSWVGAWLALPVDPQPAEVIVVLAGDPQRLDHAVDLYRQGFASEIWITGNVVSPRRKISPAVVMRQKAEAEGVPAGAIHLLATTTTWEDGHEVTALAQSRQIHSMLVVTSWYHSRRALCVIRQQFGQSTVAVHYDPAPDLTDGPDQWWRSSDRRDAVLGELAKLVGYALRYGLNLGRCL